MPETAAPVVAFRFLYVVCGGPFSTYDRRFIERKRQLRRLLGRRRSRIFYLDHVEKDGKLLFEQIVKMDLEGMVCKRQNSAYRVTEKPSPYWIRVKNPRYSGAEGREELFERVNPSTVNASAHEQGLNL